MNAPRGPRGWTLAEDVPPLAQIAEYASSNGRQNEMLEELVPPDNGCTCGERRVDELVWCGPDGPDGSPFVECQSCGREFIPGEVAR